MAQTAIVKKHCTLFVYSWTTGFVKAKTPQRVKTDDDAIAYAMFLNRKGNPEEAEAFLDEYCK